jgi:hypothetical protein
LVDGDCHKRRPKPAGQNARTYSYGAALAFTVSTHGQTAEGHTRGAGREARCSLAGLHGYIYERAMYTVSRIWSKHSYKIYFVNREDKIMLLVRTREKDQLI